MEVRDNGTNPLIILSAQEVADWLRSKADEAGYGDRETCAFQLNTELPIEGGKTYHHECPSLLIMVSNIKNSRSSPFGQQQD